MRERSRIPLALEVAAGTSTVRATPRHEEAEAGSCVPVATGRHSSWWAPLGSLRHTAQAAGSAGLSLSIWDGGGGGFLRSTGAACTATPRRCWATQSERAAAQRHRRGSGRAGPVRGRTERAGACGPERAIWRSWGPQMGAQWATAALAQTWQGPLICPRGRAPFPACTIPRRTRY